MLQSQSQIKNIIFDLGGVLIDWNPKYVFRTVFDTEKEVDDFLANICTMEWNVQQDAGRSLEEATRILTEKHPKWKKEIAQYYGRWEEMLGGPIDANVKVLRELIASKKYRVLALTNWSAETFPIAQSRYDFLGWFEGIVVSGEEGCIKPDPKIYKILFERYDLDPSECLFIDDNLDNVAGSKACGMEAILCRPGDDLREGLRNNYLVT